MQLDVYVPQQVNGEWKQRPLPSKRLFSGRNEYARQIVALLVAGRLTGRRAGPSSPHLCLPGAA